MDYAQAFSTRTIDREQGWITQALSLRGLPEPMAWELAWFVHQQVADGYSINIDRFQKLRRGLNLAIEHGGPSMRSVRSLTALTHEEWAREVRRASMRTNTSANANLATIVQNSLKHLRIVLPTPITRGSGGG